MPQNWKHYIGVNFNNLDADIKRLKSSPRMLEDVACAGREWASANYSPKASAQRFLDLIAQL
jgi:hypothetical protein